MDKLIQNFSIKSVTDFFKSKIAAFSPNSENLDYIIEGNDFINFSNLQKVGEVAFNNSDELIVFTCKFNGLLSERSSKKRQFEIAKKVLKEDFKDGAIFIFYDENNCFRFSFIRKNYGNKEQKFTNWKRYTYFVDPSKKNKTFKNRINGCNFSSLEDIQEAFSVEPLNIEFYDKIVRSFYSLVGGEIGSGRSKEKLEANLILPGNLTDRNLVRQFGVRLTGRIIFCWFLKHKVSSNGKSLISEDWLSKFAVQDDYYHSKLELLFYEILNKDLKSRPVKILPENHVDIPFLNGGLFEPQSGKDSDYYDLLKSENQRSNYGLKISDKWFSELFDVLEQYNFTIDENSINDAEVSIDPEMLGRIFENLLAEIDPNLEASEKTSVRKATGSFYTPREIVDYMVEEAIVKYLFNQTNISEGALHQLFGDAKELDFSNNQREIIIESLNQVKILDPAAGSGAFPMGALHKIVIALQKLDPGAKIWKEKQIRKMPAALQEEMKQILDNASSEYARKLGILQHCIYGADIQPIAAEISRLRSFLSLIVDTEIDDNKKNRGIFALPNLDFKFVTANTLISLDNSGKLETEKVSKLLPDLQQIRLDYLQAHGLEKENLRKKFLSIQKEIFKAQLSINADMTGRAMQLASWNPFVNEANTWFDAEWMFGVKQFDIVIGNPPYGGTKIDDKIQKELALGSKDPYGAFIAKYLFKPNHNTYLKDKGILAYIVSDTFMTIKSHKILREYLMSNTIHSMLRVHPDTFKATVNTVIMLCERNETKIRPDNKVIMADFTNISIHENHNRFVQLMDKVTCYKMNESDFYSVENENVLFKNGEDWTSESSGEYAIYTYPQDLIRTNSNIPFFVASPNLFKLLNDTTAPKKMIKIDNKQIYERTIVINNKSIGVVKLGDIADVKQGLATGDNDAYLYQNPEARGTYRDVNDFKKYLLSVKDLEKISANENIRKLVIDKGISKDNEESLNYFGGRYIIPYDKGGESDAEGGWMPNYYVPTNYYIDWSEESIYRMKNYVSEKQNGKIASRFQNIDYYFIKGLTWSDAGFYSPTIRFSGVGVFDVKGSRVIVKKIELKNLIGVLNSKLLKLIIKSINNTTVSTQVDDFRELPIKEIKLDELVSSIIKKQENINLFYDFASYEQLEIDYLVYKAYGLNWSDVQEVENWYARRYTKLVGAQKQNLKKLGKKTDYLEIYKDFIEKYGDLV